MASLQRNKNTPSCNRNRLNYAIIKLRNILLINVIQTILLCASGLIVLVSTALYLRNNGITATPSTLCFLEINYIFENGSSPNIAPILSDNIFENTYDLIININPQLLLESDDVAVHSASIYKGYHLPHAVLCLDSPGRNICIRKDYIHLVHICNIENMKSKYKNIYCHKQKHSQDVSNTTLITSNDIALANIEANIILQIYYKSTASVLRSAMNVIFRNDSTPDIAPMPSDNIRTYHAYNEKVDSAEYTRNISESVSDLTMNVNPQMKRLKLMNGKLILRNHSISMESYNIIYTNHVNLSQINKILLHKVNAKVMKITSHAYLDSGNVSFDANKNIKTSKQKYLNNCPYQTNKY